MKSLLLVGMLGLSMVAIAGTANATMTCDPLLFAVCTGDSGTDLFAHCDGNWIDVWALGAAYAQVCAGHDGDNHVCVEAPYDDINETCTVDVHG